MSNLVRPQPGPNTDFYKWIQHNGRWIMEFRPQAFISRGWRYIQRDRYGGRWQDPITGRVYNCESAMNQIMKRETEYGS